VNFASMTLYVASQRVFIFVVYFVIDSVRKLLDTPWYVPVQSVQGTVSLEVKRPGREADRSPPSSVVKYAWSFTSTL